MGVPKSLPPAYDDPATNRRKRGRVKCSHLSCTLGRVLDISASGLRVGGTGFGPGKGSVVSIQIIGPEERVPVQAKVVWLKRRLFRFEAGLEFTALSASARRSIAEIARMTSSNVLDAQRM